MPWKKDGRSEEEARSGYLARFVRGMEARRLTASFDLGSKHEQQLRFRGESDQAPNTEPGDVIIVLQQEPHALFQRSGDNLVMKHKINLVESLCGFQLVITHLDGRKVVLKHPANDPIAPGRIFVSTRIRCSRLSSSI